MKLRMELNKYGAKIKGFNLHLFFLLKKENNIININSQNGNPRERNIKKKNNKLTRLIRVGYKINMLQD